MALSELPSILSVPASELDAWFAAHGEPAFRRKQVMLAVTLMVGTVYSVINILVDVVHGLLDPRLMEQG